MSLTGKTNLLLLLKASQLKPDTTQVTVETFSDLNTAKISIQILFQKLFTTHMSYEAYKHHPKETMEGPKKAEYSFSK